MRRPFALSFTCALAWPFLLAMPATAQPGDAHLALPDTGLYDTSSVALLVVGPSFAYAPGNGQRSGFLAGGDVTLTSSFSWASVGARLRPGDDWSVYPYLEAGIWFGINLGAGYSMGVGGGVPRHNWHLFVGIPVPLNALSDSVDPLVLVEPYYRPTFGIGEPSESPTLHELGMLLKWALPFGEPY